MQGARDLGLGGQPTPPLPGGQPSVSLRAAAAQTESPIPGARIHLRIGVFSHRSQRGIRYRWSSTAV
eukprot:1194666-Prorocentrum_minimum.AAC.10